ncbi:MAG TPA: hypothetical protein VFI31_19330 [Pirellulales bacterium]|nr:hypothetical protein [Pirellulales bacterium]
MIENRRFLWSAAIYRRFHLWRSHFLLIAPCMIDSRLKNIALLRLSLALAHRVHLAALLLITASAAFADESTKLYTSESLRGKVVWLADALDERYGIKSDDDVAHAVVALETPEGELHPIVKDKRGRAFHTDERLRGIDLELLVRRYNGSPMVQVLRVYAIKPDGKYELDYWCDVCSIAMYELKPCECCQGNTRLRERLVEKRKSDSENE